MGSALLIGSLGESRSFKTRYGSRVAIVGGGLLGATLALRYRQAGRIVTLFEAAERLERRGHATVSTRDRALIGTLNELKLADQVRWDSVVTLGARFGELRGGRAQIVETLRDRARAVDVDVRLGTPVREIISDGSGFIVNTDAETGEFDQVVLTVPSPVASQLMPALPDKERLSLLDIAYVGIVTVSFVLEQRVAERYISRVSRGRGQFTLINPGALRPGNERMNVIYVTSPLDVTSALFQADDREVIESFARAVPGTAQIVRARVMRMPHAFAKEQLSSFSSSLDGLSIVNAAHMNNGRHHLERTASLATTAFRALCAERIA